MKAQDKLVSIIVPVYNAGSYIEETIRMVEAQTYVNWELLLIDDKSSDQSRKLIADYIQKKEANHGNGQIRLIAKPRNEGAAEARNTGIKEAKGRYIAFLDADDIWFSNKLMKEIAFISAKQAAFVFTAYEFGNEHAEPTGKIVHVPATLSYRQALSRTVIFTTTVLLDAEKISKDLIYMPNVPSEDSATWWKILRSGVVAHGLDEVLAIYRRPTKSLSSNKVEAIRRIWFLYRKVEKLSLVFSIYNFICWAFRATVRRI